MGRWKFSLPNHSSSSSSSPSNSTSIPPEFLCPISGSLMADPVILPSDLSGRSFDRSSLLACSHLHFSPPQLPDLHLSPNNLLLIPNVALKTAILGWCDRSNLSRPLPVPLDDAVAAIRKLMLELRAHNHQADENEFSTFGAQSFGADEINHMDANFQAMGFGTDRIGDRDVDFQPVRAGLDRFDNNAVMSPSPSVYGRFRGKEDEFQLKPAAYGAPGMMKFGQVDTEEGDDSLSKLNQKPPNMRPRKPSSSSFASTISTVSSSSSSSSYTSADINVDPLPMQEIPTAPTFTPEFDDVEQEMFNKLKDSDQELASTQLRKLTRESSERRLALCTPRLLAALRPLLLSRTPNVQSNATAALVNLSLEPQNKTVIIRSGLVPPLIDALKSSTTHQESKDNAAATLFSLALEEAHRVAIGVLGALPPLLVLFVNPNSSPHGRRDAGMALYHLSLAGTNRSKLARAPGAVRALLGVAAEDSPSHLGHMRGSLPLARLAMMIVCNLASCNEGRGVLMDGGAVAAVVELLRSGMGDEEHCLVALYGMSKGSLRFRGLAKAVGAERVLATVVESGGESNRELARRVIRVMRGEEDGHGNLVAAASLPTRFREDYNVSDSRIESPNSTAF